MSARTSVKIDLSGSDAVRAVREGFSSLEKSERSRVLRAFRRAGSPRRSPFRAGGAAEAAAAGAGAGLGSSFGGK